VLPSFSNFKDQGKKIKIQRLENINYDLQCQCGHGATKKERKKEKKREREREREERERERAGLEQGSPAPQACTLPT
jgi:hypothetical protein